jgi:arsenate reductase
VQRVLFLCTGNSARSQMAEAWLRRLGGRWFDVHSAGTQPRSALNPMTVRVMEEAGVDLTNHWAKATDLYLGESFDHVITVCDDANEACPTFPGARRRARWSLPDPAALTGTFGEPHQAFVTCRDEIRRRVIEFIGAEARADHVGRRG